MEAELAALAATGATTVVGLMVTEGWNQARARLVRLFARGGEDEGAVEDELQESRTQLVDARTAEDEQAAADVEALWRLRLRTLLQSDPEAARQLRALMDEEWGDGGALRNTAQVGVQNGAVVQARDISGLTINGGR